MSHVIRITKHRSNPDLLVLHTPPEIRRQMGSFEAARFDPETKTYLLHPDALPGLEAFARYQSLVLHDQTENPVAGQITIPQECRHCGQPGQANKPPSYCPGCGRLWDPQGPPIDADPDGIHRTPCHGCGRRQSGRFAHCTNCGAVMVYTTEAPGHGAEQLHLELANRPHRDEPVTLAAAIEDLAENLATRPQPAQTQEA